MLRLDHVEACIERLESVKPREDEPDHVVALLFMTPCTYYRRLRDIESMKRLIERYSAYSESSKLLKALVLHTRAMLVEKSEVFGPEARLLDALRLEEEALRIEPRYIGLSTSSPI